LENWFVYLIIYNNETSMMLPNILGEDELL